MFKSLDGKVIVHEGDIEGHWITVVVELNYILVNLYGFNNRAINKMLIYNLGTMIVNWKNVYSTHKVVVADDFDVVPDECCDRFPTHFDTFFFFYNL